MTERKPRNFTAWFVMSFGVIAALAAGALPILAAPASVLPPALPSVPAVAAQPAPVVAPPRPFAPEPIDEGAIRVLPTTSDASLRALTGEGRKPTDDLRRWAASEPPAARHAWARYSDEKVAEAELRAAEYEAGLAQIGRVGVTP